MTINIIDPVTIKLPADIEVTTKTVTGADSGLFVDEDGVGYVDSTDSATVDYTALSTGTPARTFAKKDTDVVYETAGSGTEAISDDTEIVEIFEVITGTSVTGTAKDPTDTEGTRNGNIQAQKTTGTQYVEKDAVITFTAESIVVANGTIGTTNLAAEPQPVTAKLDVVEGLAIDIEAGITAKIGKNADNAEGAVEYTGDTVLYVDKAGTYKVWAEGTTGPDGSPVVALTDDTKGYADNKLTDTVVSSNSVYLRVATEIAIVGNGSNNITLEIVTDAATDRTKNTSVASETVAFVARRNVTSVFVSADGGTSIAATYTPAESPTSAASQTTDATHWKVDTFGPEKITFTLT